MSASQAKETASSSASELSSPAGGSKRYPVVACEYPSADMASAVDDTKSKKVSPSNQDFLSTLRKFNIDRAHYKHYGHSSSLNANSLEKIMNEASENSDSHFKKAKSENSAGDSYRNIIDNKVAEILELPEGLIEEESIRPYNIETLHEIIKLKTEKEKTKQEAYRSEFGNAAVELFKLARESNIDDSLIPLMFLGEAPNVDIKERIRALQTDSGSFIDVLARKSEELAPPLHRLGDKRKFSDTHLPSFSETAESIRGSGFIDSPIRSPVRSPIYTHVRTNSDESEALEKNSQSTLSLQKDQSIKSKSLQSSPQAATNAQGATYPVYFSSHSAGQSATPLSKQNVESSDQISGGSPYPQKYIPVLLPAQQGHYQNTQGFVPHQSFSYYMPSSNSNPYSYHTTSQYHSGPASSPPNKNRKSPDSLQSGHHSTKHDQEEHSTHKKQKTGTKNSINFMITTPKNPPARKYNNPKEKKTE